MRTCGRAQGGDIKDSLYGIIIFSARQLGVSADFLKSAPNCTKLSETVPKLSERPNFSVCTKPSRGASPRYFRTPQVGRAVRSVMNVAAVLSRQSRNQVGRIETIKSSLLAKLSESVRSCTKLSETGCWAMGDCRTP